MTGNVVPNVCRLEPPSLIGLIFFLFSLSRGISCKITKQQEVFIDTVSLLDRKGVMTLFDVFSLD